MSKLANAMNERSDAPPPLSEAGVARREAMLPLLERAMAGRVRRRRLSRIGAGAGVLVLAGLVLIRTWPVAPAAPSAPSPIVAVEPDPPAVAPLAMRYASFHVVQSAPETGAIVRVDDETLLRELRQIGHPTGLIRARGQVVLTADIGLKSGGPDETPGNI